MSLLNRVDYDLITVLETDPSTAQLSSTILKFGRGLDSLSRTVLRQCLIRSLAMGADRL